MEDLSGKLSVEKGRLFNTLCYVSMTIFLLTQEILGLYCFFYLLYSTTVLSLSYLFLCFASLGALAWKVILINVHNPFFLPDHWHNDDGVTTVYTCFQVNKKLNMTFFVHLTAALDVDNGKGLIMGQPFFIARIFFDIEGKWESPGCSQYLPVSIYIIFHLYFRITMSPLTTSLVLEDRPDCTFSC